MRSCLSRLCLPSTRNQRHRLCHSVVAANAAHDGARGQGREDGGRKWCLAVARGRCGRRCCARRQARATPPPKAVGRVLRPPSASTMPRSPSPGTALAAPTPAARRTRHVTTASGAAPGRGLARVESAWQANLDLLEGGRPSSRSKASIPVAIPRSHRPSRATSSQLRHWHDG